MQIIEQYEYTNYVKSLETENQKLHALVSLYKHRLEEALGEENIDEYDDADILLLHNLKPYRSMNHTLVEGQRISC